MGTCGQLKESKYIFRGNLPCRRAQETCINRSRFALYQRHDFTESLPCMVLFLVHGTTNVARIVAQDQNGTPVMEVIRKHVLV